VNLDSVRDEDWNWLPPDGMRSIAWLVEGLGNSKYVYASQAFGDGSMHWSKDGSLPELPARSTRNEAIEWLRFAHSQLRERVEALEDDSELVELRPSPFGDQRPTRWLIRTMIEHDMYHAGEISHIRALAQKNCGPQNG
jgi:hypothetical protein